MMNKKPSGIYVDHRNSEEIMRYDEDAIKALRQRVKELEADAELYRKEIAELRKTLAKEERASVHHAVFIKGVSNHGRR